MIVIVGPTAAGKSARAMALAPSVNGEIISADSRHVYSGMDIGTNKPSAAERAAVPHHLLDLRPPEHSFSLAEYVALARPAIEAIQARGGTPMLVGGTGQYVRALLEGWQVPAVPPNDAARARWQSFAHEQGQAALFAELTRRDPGAADTIDPRNIRRVIRALEVMEATGERWSDLQRRVPPKIPVTWVYVNLPREALHQAVDTRLQRMLDAGWLDETRALLAHFAGRGIDAESALRLPAMSALGYREMAAVALGRSTLPEAVEAIKRETRRFIRMQDTWFRALEANHKAAA